MSLSVRNSNKITLIRLKLCVKYEVSICLNIEKKYGGGARG